MEKRNVFMIVGIFIGMILGTIFYVSISNTEDVEEDMPEILGGVDNMNDKENLYQGPVPKGYDLEHFRKTGETIKEVEN